MEGMAPRCLHSSLDQAEALGEGGSPLILPVLEAETCLWDTLPRVICGTHSPQLQTETPRGWQRFLLASCFHLHQSLCHLLPSHSSLSHCNGLWAH